MREKAVPALPILVTSIGVIGVTHCILLWRAPRLFLGQDGIWILEAIVGSLPEKLNRFGWAGVVRTRFGVDKIHA